MKQVPNNLLALSSFGFSIAHFCLPFVALLLTCLSISLATGNLARTSLVSSSTALPDHVYPSGGFTSNMVSTNLIGLGFLRHSNNRLCGAQAQYIAVELGMILLSARLPISFFTSGDKFPCTISHWVSACNTLIPIPRVKRSLMRNR